MLCVSHANRVRLLRLQNGCTASWEALTITRDRAGLGVRAGDILPLVRRNGLRSPFFNIIISVLYHVVATSISWLASKPSALRHLGRDDQYKQPVFFAMTNRKSHGDLSPWPELGFRGKGWVSKCMEGSFCGTRGCNVQRNGIYGTGTLYTVAAPDHCCAAAAVGGGPFVGR